MTRNGSGWILIAAFAFGAIAAPARAQQISEGRIRELIRQAAERATRGESAGDPRQATAPGQTRRKPSAMAEAASGAAIDPLKESGAMTTTGGSADMRVGYDESG